MSTTANGRVKADHLARNAYLYVRQSTLRQVRENTESTKRQYGLRRRAVELGWQRDQIITVDDDLGQSGADRNRKGFNDLVSEVGLGRAGIVLGLEVSRLARNSSDWHRLLEICAISGTLILDEDGVYDPKDFNDRLLLGLKGTMSEAELHMLKARLQGGQLSKARRGELKIALPIGLIYDPLDRVVLDPDEGVRRSLQLVFDVFERTGSASATVRYFSERSLQVPVRPRYGPARGELLWRPLPLSHAMDILQNPAYAGAFAYGRFRQRRNANGKLTSVRVPRSDWTELIPGHHPDYISWERFEQNQVRLASNGAAFQRTGRRSPAREGAALLQGLALCGICGSQMGARYGSRGDRTVPYYRCNGAGALPDQPSCQVIVGTGVDRAIGDLLVEEMTPLNAELAIAVQRELEQRADEADRLRALKVQRRREEADLARRRYRMADPANRLVADVLEAEWNRALQDLESETVECERLRARDRRRLDERQLERIRALVSDFPRLWSDPATPHRERKRMARMLIEDVTIVKGERITLGVRMRGGAGRKLSLSRPLSAADLYRTPEAVIAKVDALLDEYTDAQTARELDRRGYRPTRGGRYKAMTVTNLRRRHDLKSRYQRLRERGLLSRDEIAARLAVSPRMVKCWTDCGLLEGLVANDKGQLLYPCPQDPAGKSRPGDGKETLSGGDQMSHPINEVQYAT